MTRVRGLGGRAAKLTRMRFPPSSRLFRLFVNPEPVRPSILEILFWIRYTCSRFVSASNGGVADEGCEEGRRRERRLLKEKSSDLRDAEGLNVSSMLHIARKRWETHVKAVREASPSRVDSRLSYRSSSSSSVNPPKTTSGKHESWFWRRPSRLSCLNRAMLSSSRRSSSRLECVRSRSCRVRPQPSFQTVNQQSDLLVRCLGRARNAPLCHRRTP